MLWRIFLFLTVLWSPTLSARSLSEAEFVREFLERNPELAAIRLNPEISAQAEREFQGGYDLNLNLESNYLVDQSARANAVFGTDSRLFRYELGVSKKFPFGLQGGFSFATERSTSNSAFATVSPGYEPILRFEWRQPLLKNSFGTSDRKTSQALSLWTDRVSLASKRQAEERLAEGLGSYWNLATRQSFMEVNQQFLETSRSFLKSVKNRKDLGTAETTDYLAAQALLLERENFLTEARARYEDSQETVLQLLQQPFGWEISASENPALGYKRTLDEEIAEALEKRSDLLALKKELEAREVQVKVAKNQKWPVVDLVGTLELNGFRGNYNDALQDSFSADNPALFAGVEATAPLPNRGARSRLKKEELERQQLVYRLQDFEAQVLREVRESYRNLTTRLSQVTNFEEISRLQKQKWEAEKKKFFQGRSLSDTVIRYERESVEAEWNLIEARFLSRLASITLQRATGNLAHETDH